MLSTVCRELQPLGYDSTAKGSGWLGGIGTKVYRVPGWVPARKAGGAEPLQHVPRPAKLAVDGRARRGRGFAHVFEGGDCFGPCASFKAAVRIDPNLLRLEDTHGEAEEFVHFVGG